MPDWQPGDPLYEQHDAGRIYQQQPMIEERDDGSSLCPVARWRPIIGWTDIDE
jgi:hypothetical protein